MFLVSVHFLEQLMTVLEFYISSLGILAFKLN